MRKIIITEEQADRLSGALLKVRRFPDFLMDAVKGNATPIGDCKYIYGNFIENSLRKRYDEIFQTKQAVQPLYEKGGTYKRQSPKYLL